MFHEQLQKDIEFRAIKWNTVQKLNPTIPYPLFGMQHRVPTPIWVRCTSVYTYTPTDPHCQEEWAAQ